jgi:hypothetical protein
MWAEITPGAQAAALTVRGETRRGRGSLSRRLAPHRRHTTPPRGVQRVRASARTNTTKTVCRHAPCEASLRRTTRASSVVGTAASGMRGRRLNAPGTLFSRANTPLHRALRGAPATSVFRGP